MKKDSLSLKQASLLKRQANLLKQLKDVNEKLALRELKKELVKRKAKSQKTYGYVLFKDEDDPEWSFGLSSLKPGFIDDYVLEKDEDFVYYRLLPALSLGYETNTLIYSVNEHDLENLRKKLKDLGLNEYTQKW